MSKARVILNKTTAQALNQKAIDGVEKYLPHAKTIAYGGATYTTAAIKEGLQAETDASKATDEARAQYRQQVVAGRVARSKGRTLRKFLKGYVLSNFGVDAVQTLEDFGIPVPKPLGKTPVKSKAQGLDKAEATRKAKKEALASLDAPAPNAAPQPAPTVTPPKS